MKRVWSAGVRRRQVAWRWLLGPLAALSFGGAAPAATAPGLAGAYYSVGPDDISSVDEALALIAGLTPTATFTAHTVCFPTCGGVSDDADSLSSFLGVSSGYVTDLSTDFVGLDHHVLVLTGFIDVVGGGTFQFNLGSDDGSRLTFSYFDAVDNDGPHAFQSVLHPGFSVAGGLQPITIVQFENRGDTGLSVTNGPTLIYEGVPYYQSDFAFVHTEEPRGVVPEPGTWALVIGGLGLAGATLRRLRRTAAANGA